MFAIAWPAIDHARAAEEPCAHDAVAVRVVRLDPEGRSLRHGGEPPTTAGYYRRWTLWDGYEAGVGIHGSEG
jgi:hypothetical protein